MGKSMSIKKSARPFIRVKTAASLLTPSSSSSSSASSPNPAHVHELHDCHPAQKSPGASLEDKSDSFEDKSDEDMTDWAEPRSLSVSIPTASNFHSATPFFPRRPALSDILSNKAPPPWTLSAFMAYLSQNHCLETLEFTMDATRYRKHFNKMASRGPGGQLESGSEDCVYMRSLWARLLEAYIVPNGPREVNIPSDVRDHLVNYPNDSQAPNPSVLDMAVQKVYELMEESVLVPFLNSFFPQTMVSDPSENTSQEDLAYGSYDERGMYMQRRVVRSQNGPSPSATMSAGPVQGRGATSSSTFQQFAKQLSSRHASSSSRMSLVYASRNPAPAAISPTTSHGSDMGHLSPHEYTTGDEVLGTPPSGFGEPMTPPDTPPQSDHTSPRREPGGTWKKMRSSFTFKKKTSGSLREEESDGHGNFI